MDECFQKKLFLSIKKKKKRRRRVQTRTKPLFPFVSVYYVEGKQAVTRDDKLVTVTWVLFLLASAAFSKTKKRKQPTF